MFRVGTFNTLCKIYFSGWLFSNITLLDTDFSFRNHAYWNLESTTEWTEFFFAFLQGQFLSWEFIGAPIFSLFGCFVINTNLIIDDFFCWDNSMRFFFFIFIFSFSFILWFFFSRFIFITIFFFFFLFFFFFFLSKLNSIRILFVMIKSNGHG